MPQRRVPAILAFLLLCFQMSIPWTVPNFVTQDGSSHLYNAGIVCDLVFRRSHTPYRHVYGFHRWPSSNWGATAFMAGTLSLAGPKDAEKLFASMSILAGFLAFWYASASLLPGLATISPIANFVLQNWFLWIGFHSFYLGMALVPALLGFYLRSRDRLTLLRAAVLGAGALALFAIHFIPGAIAAMTLLVTGVWVDVFAPILFLRAEGRNRRFFLRRTRETLTLIAALLPACLTLVFYAAKQPKPLGLDLNIAAAWHRFPLQIFQTGSIGEESMLWPAILFAIVLAILTLTREDWRGPKGGVVIAAALMFALYLLVPDSGFGGSDAKIRFSLAFFVFGCLLVSSSRTFAPFRLPASLYTAFFLGSSLLHALSFTQKSSSAAADYLAALNDVPPGARVVRFFYGVPDAMSRYGLSDAGRNPFFHLDALAAARRRWIDLSDYEGCNDIFPLLLKQPISSGQRSVLWSFEGPDQSSKAAFAWLQPDLRIEYVVVAGETDWPEAAQHGMLAMLDYLGSQGRIVGQSKSGPFVRVYKLGKWAG